MEKNKKSFFDAPIFSSRIKSDKVKLFPEGALGYLVGPTLAMLANSTLSSYFNKYMTDVLDITSWGQTFFTLLPIISTIFVVIGNILVGRLMDNMKTRAGKARPILLISVPVCLIALISLFVLPPFANGTADANTQLLALVFIAIGYNLWYGFAYPLYYTSHSSLVTLSTRDSKDRSLLATIANATQLAAIGATTMILPFFLGLLFVQGPNGLDQVASYNNWKIFVVALIVVTFIGAFTEFLFTRERITEESFTSNDGGEMEVKKAEPVSKQLAVCVKDKYWWIIIAFYFLYQLGGMMKNTSQLYYCSSNFSNAAGEFSTAVGGTFHGTLSIIGAIPTAVGMVIAWPLSNKIGKGKAILFGSIISAIGGIIGFIDPTNFVLACVAFVVKALGSTPAMYLSLALLADILDHQEAQHGFRTNGITMTIYGAIMAGMTGIATGILNIVLGIVGYNANALNTPALQNAMTWLFFGGETIGYGLIAIIFIFMNVEKFSKEDQEIIAARNKANGEESEVAVEAPAAE